MITAHITKLQQENSELQDFNFKVVESTTSNEPGEWIHKKIGMLFTHFGIYGLECLSVGIPVFFSNPSIYHQELVRRYFPELELKQVIWDNHNSALLGSFNGLKDTYRFGNKAHEVVEIIEKLCHPQANSLIPHVSKNPVRVDKTCELCGGSALIVHRSNRMNLAQCQSCKSVRMLELFDLADIVRMECGGSEDYDADYFIEEYEASYGKTYREDEVIIKNHGGTKNKTN